jgi:hypothetical protein
LGNKNGILFLFLSLVIAKDAGGILNHRFLPPAYLAGVDLKTVNQFGYRLFTL